MIRAEQIDADVLLCPGDLGDRASAAGVAHAWQLLHRIAAALGGSEVIATAGNHDLSSRPDGPEPTHDPEETLQQLTPLFPHYDRPVQQAFFSDHYAIINGGAWRVVTLNSSAHHGRGVKEYDFGRVTRATRTRLSRDLETCERVGVNILLCHHHPVEYTDVDEPDRSTMAGGALLLSELVKAPIGPWVVIHGHKHLPYLGYAPGSSGSPVVFAAGSLSASLHLSQQPHTRNQFYLCEFDFDATRTVGARILGRFRSWYWVNNRGWLPTDPGSGLPAEGGFGFRADPRHIAERIVGILNSARLPSIAWNDLLASIPELEFVIPQDLAEIQGELTAMRRGVIPDSNGRFQEVSQQWP